jgi:hypothetical protein
VTIRDFKKKKAPKQEAILDAFEQAGWEKAIEMSSTSGKDLSDAVLALNEKLNPPLIHFHMVGTGNTVEWDLASNQPTKSEVTGT